MKPLVAALIFSLAAALVPVPRITLQNPTLLYAAAIYKTALGDTHSALRLVHRAEQAQQPAVLEPSDHTRTAQAAPARSTNL